MQCQQLSNSPSPHTAATLLSQPPFTSRRRRCRRPLTGWSRARVTWRRRASSSARWRSRSRRTRTLQQRLPLRWRRLLRVPPARPSRCPPRRCCRRHWTMRHRRRRRRRRLHLAAARRARRSPALAPVPAAVPRRRRRRPPAAAAAVAAAAARRRARAVAGASEPGPASPASSRGVAGARVLICARYSDRAVRVCDIARPLTHEIEPTSADACVPSYPLSRPLCLARPCAVSSFDCPPRSPQTIASHFAIAPRIFAAWLHLGASFDAC
jgi:hypothetical protein